MSKRSKEFLILLALAAGFLAITVATASDKALTFRDYTAYSANPRGVSLLYDTLERLNYPVETTTRAVTPYTDTHDLQIIINPSPYYASAEDMDALISWVERGGRVLLFYGDGDYLVSIARAAMEDDPSIPFYDGEIFNYGMGYAYFQWNEDILNANLMEDGFAGQYILELLEGFGYEKILFNEYYHGYGTEAGMWDAVPLSAKLVAYQVIIASAAAVLYLGRRFGRAIPYYEEQEREENEYVATLSNLYLQVGMGEVIIQMFSSQFQKNAARYFRLGPDADFTAIRHCWHTAQLPGLSKLDYIIGKADADINTKNRAGRREFIKTVDTIKELNRIVSKPLF